MQKDYFPSLPQPKSPDVVRVLCLGDIVGKGGVAALRKECRRLRSDYSLDLIVANGENAAGGVGIDVPALKDLFSLGIDVITLGDHVWSKREMISYFDKNTDPAPPCVRPANYPAGAPGSGLFVGRTTEGVPFAVLNLMGRAFCQYFLDCPFKKANALLDALDAEVKIKILDFHCEATSEKVAMGRHLDGRVSLIFGTHTHVQTADEQVLPGGTGYISDCGMCGVADGVIGMDAETALGRFISGMPRSYKGAVGRTRLSGVVADIDMKSGFSVQRERVRRGAFRGLFRGHVD